MGRSDEKSHKPCKEEFSEFFIKHRHFFFQNGQINDEVQYLIHAFRADQISQIAQLAENEAFYTLVNLINSRIRIKKENFEKYPEDLWKIIKMLNNKK